ncbi:TetR/AcrR family transcriptional regulator [Nocardia blacklockiae]|uniref:TetR/AcrR family transcriptional regulator n=1 Tax=Nocardia blacklockiae TaxID=480036 RepID=UPI0018935C34|nr:TetR/AcrR family transcriptional regulator [Nocardia blacklockiae]MBF6175360.1 TetR/AcrR family transcriptional regulator [Nocardia blacklockiae]
MATTRTTRPQRSDWQRNHQRLLTVAAELVARDGAGVSLEEIARRAEIGSATLHRHFPSRQALLEEIFRDGVERLCRRADELAREDPARGLVRWLEELAVYTANTRGLALSLAMPAHPDGSCHAWVADTAAALMTHAVEAGTVRPGISLADLLDLVNAISIATEGDGDAARRLLRLAVDGLHP